MAERTWFHHFERHLRSLSSAQEKVAITPVHVLPLLLLLGWPKCEQSKVFFRARLLCRHCWASWLENGASNARNLMPWSHNSVFQLSYCSSLHMLITDQSFASLLCQASYKGCILQDQDVQRNILTKSVFLISLTRHVSEKPLLVIVPGLEKRCPSPSWTCIRTAVLLL